MAKSAFVGVMKNLARDRHFGGTDKNVVADPYISGYHYIKWTQLPPKLKNYVKAGDGAQMGELSSEKEMSNFLESSCLSVTPPGGTLNKTEFNGVGGLKWSVPTNLDYNNVITIKFLEFSHLPITNIISGWVRMIRDFKTGTSHLNMNDEAYTKSEYAGTLLYWTTKPDGHTVEFSGAYTGMFPQKDPRDLFTSDITAIDKLEIDIDFNVDYAWHEQWVHTKCQQEADYIWDENDPTLGYRGSLTSPNSGSDNTVTK